MAWLWSYPAGKIARVRHPTGRLVVGYLMGATTLIAMTFLLGIFGWGRRGVVFFPWMLVWSALTLYAFRSIHRRAPVATRIDLKETTAVTLLTLLGLYLLSYDAARHISPAAIDSYRFVVFLDSFLNNGIIFRNYIIGLPILLGHLRIFPNDALETMRWGPPVLAAAGIPSFFFFYSRIFDRRTAILGTILLSGSVFLVPITSYQILFIQFSTLGLALPALFFYFPRAVLSASATGTLSSAIVILFLAFTSTYFALMLCVIFGLWLLFNLATRAISRSGFFRGLALLSLVPLWIGLYYRILVPLTMPEIELGLARQMTTFAFNPLSPSLEFMMQQSLLEQAIAAFPWLEKASESPGFTTLWAFLCPKRLLLARPSILQSMMFWGLTLLAFPLLQRPASSRGLIGFSMLVTSWATITGMFDMPAYRGRHLYLLIMMGLPAAAFTMIRILIPRIARTGDRIGFKLSPRALETLVLALALLSCVPALYSPPEAGLNIPASEELILREIPEDDLLVAMARNVPPDTPGNLWVVRTSANSMTPGETVRILNDAPTFSPLRILLLDYRALHDKERLQDHPPRYLLMENAAWNRFRRDGRAKRNNLRIGNDIFITDRVSCYEQTDGNL